MRIFFYLIFIVFLSLPSTLFAQQEPQYTQYMYNTQIINPAYSGNRKMLSFGLLYRTQWVGIEGAPKTVTFTINSPIGKRRNMGLGLSVIHDEIGPSTQTDVAIDYAYAIPVDDDTRLSFGIKGGFDVLEVDFTKLDIYNPHDPLYQENIDNRWQPKIGAGVYLNTDHWYIGASVPNFLETQHYVRSNNSNMQSIASDRMHFYFIGGYVFDFSFNLQFKPTTMIKVVRGAPLQWDFSANFIFDEKLTLGASWRGDAALAAMAGFQVSPSIFLGVGYDYQLTDLQKYSDGSYEVIMRFDVINTFDAIMKPFRYF
ncbi:MAG TPA: type IX secretion system membrane protein PorP/SprF [Candidatus Sphingobacterium stercoripullorum]|nr:type IX secretion system membrane protein PorP/SprF [Candidatus Sphingobacterium stercoripullorum]HLS11302.1 type IX secretion system membrane protein PorP/SprF [Flavobacteriaceae bacterium]